MGITVPDRAGRTAMKGTEVADPWRALVIVAQIPKIGLSRELEADAATRAAMAEIAGLRDILSARAVFVIKPESGGRVHVAGKLSARVGQTCVVTLDPIENDIDEPIDLIFAPPEQLARLANRDHDEAEGRAEAVDQLEPIENGVIDLGRLASDVLYLAIDPYPRKSGAVFESQIAAADPKDRPFAVLKALKLEPNPPAAATPKDK
jgi:uncharacterized metal-binding protein YceD (DUF177 family)